MVSCVVDFSVLVRQSDLLYESVRAGSNQVKLPSAKVCSADQCGCAPPVTEQKTMFSLCDTQMLYMFFFFYYWLAFFCLAMFYFFYSGF